MCNLRRHKMALNFSCFSFCLLPFVLFGRIYYITPHYYSLSEKLVAALIVTLCGAETIADNINKALQYMGRVICSIRVQLSYFPLEFFIVLNLKTIKNFSEQIRQPYAYAAYESTLQYISPAQNLSKIFNLSSKQNKSAF